MTETCIKKNKLWEVYVEITQWVCQVEFDFKLAFVNVQKGSGFWCFLF